MTLQNARNVVHFLLWEIQPKLRKIAASGNLDFNRLFLVAIRDRIHQTCVHFETHQGAEAHEEIYLSLFDALSALTFALSQQPIDGPSFRAAIDTLDDVAGLLELDQVA